MKRVCCLLCATLLVLGVFNTALSETMSLTDMQKHTSTDLSVLNGYTAVYDDNTYSAVFYKESYKINYGTFYDSRWNEVQGYVYLGFDVVTYDGDILIRPALIRLRHSFNDNNGYVAAYIKADDNRYRVSNESGDYFQYTREFGDAGFNSVPNITMVLDPVGYHMLVNMSIANNVTIAGKACDARTIAAITGYLNDIQTMGIEIPNVTNGWYTCYTNWND